MYLDVTRWIPLGDIFEVRGDSSNTLPLPAVIYPSGIIGIVGEMLANQSSFTGKKIWENDSSQTLTESVGRAFDHLYKAFMPNLPIWGTYAGDKIGNAFKGATDSVGREYSLGQAALSAVGVKVNSYDVATLKRNNSFDYQTVRDKITKNMTTLSRDYARNKLTKEEFDSRIASEREKLLKVTKDFAEKMRD